MATIVAISVFFFLSNEGVESEANQWQQGSEGQKEYLFENSKSRNFTEAKRFCQLNDATLPMIRSIRQQIDVHSMVSQVPHNYDYDFIWLGAQNSRYPGQKFGLWLDGSAISYTNWVHDDETYPGYLVDGICMNARKGKWTFGLPGSYFDTTVCERPVKNQQ